MKLDFHIHTDVSPCSSMSLETAVEAAISKGLQGVAVCNHDTIYTLTNKEELENKFNIAINPESSVENAFYIISGIELSLPGTHVLGLFVNESISGPFSPEKIVEKNGVLVLAHPFQHASNYLERAKKLQELLKFKPLVEAGSGRANYKNRKACDEAERFAKENSLCICAGSDAHFPEEIGNAYIEVEDVVGIDAIREQLLSGNVQIYSKNAKRKLIAKSQIVKHGYSLKSIVFYIYSVVRDLGDMICRK